MAVRLAIQFLLIKVYIPLHLMLFLDHGKEFVFSKWNLKSKAHFGNILPLFVTLRREKPLGIICNYSKCQYEICKIYRCSKSRNCYERSISCLLSFNRPPRPDLFTKSLNLKKITHNGYKHDQQKRSKLQSRFHSWKIMINWNYNNWRTLKWIWL